MEKKDTHPDNSSDKLEKQEKVFNFNYEIENAVKIFLESEEYRDTAEFFSDWILSFVKQQIHLFPEIEFKLYDLYEIFNQSLLKMTRSEDLQDTAPFKSRHFIIESILIEQLLKEAINDKKILNFIDSPQWNDLRLEFCNSDEIDFECIESLEKLIMFLDLMRLKINKFDLNQGW